MFNLLFKFFYNFLFLSKNILFVLVSIFVLSCNNSSTSPFMLPLGLTIDPYKLSPLSAVYVIESVNEKPITVKVKGLYGEPDIIHTYSSGYGREFEIHGMFPEAQNIIEIVDGDKTIVTNVYIGKLIINGETIPSKLSIDISNLKEDEKYKNNPEMYFLHYTYGLDSWDGTGSVAVSKNGHVRYALKKYTPSKVRVEDGRNVIYVLSGYSIFDMLGKPLVNIPHLNHHDAIKINDNYFYLSSSSFGMGDMFGVVDRNGNDIKFLSFGMLIKNSLDLNSYPEDANIFKEIVYGESVDNIYIENGQQKNIDWFHSNSLVYDSATDILYVSSKHRGVFAIDYSEWKLIWWMVNESHTYSVNGKTTQLYDLKSLDKYRVKGDAIKEGPSGQHALFLLANGNLAMFDNQVEGKKQSRYIEYKIDNVNGQYSAKVIEKIEIDSLNARITSDIDFLGENYNNLLLTYGDNTKVIVEIEKVSRNKLFQLKMPFGTHLYRADKMPLYYDEGRVYSEDCNLKNAN